jgi:hypothetical protein
VKLDTLLRVIKGIVPTRVDQNLVAAKEAYEALSVIGEERA